MKEAKLTDVSPAALPVPEAARYLGMSESAFRALHREGEIDFVYLTSHPVVRVADLDVLLASAPTAPRKKAAA